MDFRCAWCSRKATNLLAKRSPMTFVCDEHDPGDQEDACHCGQDGHPIESVHCPVHGTVTVPRPVLDILLRGASPYQLIDLQIRCQYCGAPATQPEQHQEECAWLMAWRAVRR